MKAIIWTKYGSPDGLQLQEVDKPALADKDVLIKVHATTVITGDCEMRSLKFPLWLSLPMRLYTGIMKPSRVRILGQELAGEVEAVGKDVTRFKPGDRVFGTTGFRFGAYAEYASLSAESDDSVLAIIPDNMSYEEATTLPTGGLESLHFLRQANIQPGQKLLINGAGGSIGTFAVQLGKYYGAEVTAVDSTAKLEMLSSIGADHVIDYTQDDFATDGETYDVIFDVVGIKSFSRSIRALKEDGIYLPGNPRLSDMFRGPWISNTSNKTVIIGSATRRIEDLNFIKELAASGKIKSVIDRHYPLEETAEAHRYVESGQKQGSVVIKVT